MVFDNSEGINVTSLEFAAMLAIISRNDDQWLNQSTGAYATHNFIGFSFGNGTLLAGSQPDEEIMSYLKMIGDNIDEAKMMRILLMLDENTLKIIDLEEEFQMAPPRENLPSIHNVSVKPSMHDLLEQMKQFDTSSGDCLLRFILHFQNNKL